MIRNFYKNSNGVWMLKLSNENGESDIEMNLGTEKLLESLSNTAIAMTIQIEKFETWKEINHTCDSDLLMTYGQNGNYYYLAWDTRTKKEFRIGLSPEVGKYFYGLPKQLKFKVIHRKFTPDVVTRRTVEKTNDVKHTVQGIGATILIVALAIPVLIFVLAILGGILGGLKELFDDLVYLIPVVILGIVIWLIVKR